MEQRARAARPSVARQLSGSSPTRSTVRAQDGLARVTLRVAAARRGEHAAGAARQERRARRCRCASRSSPAAGGERDRIAVDARPLWRARSCRAGAQGEAMVVQRAAVWLSPAARPADPPARAARHAGLRLARRPSTSTAGWRCSRSGEEAVAGQALADLDVRVGTLDAFGKRFNNVALRASADAERLVGERERRRDRRRRCPTARPRAAGRRAPRAPHRAGRHPGREAARRRPAARRDLPAHRPRRRGLHLPRQAARPRRAAGAARGRATGASTSATHGERRCVAQRQRRSGARRRRAPRSSSTCSASDVGAFLARVGYPGLVKGGKAQLQGSLAWQRRSRRRSTTRASAASCSCRPRTASSSRSTRASAS